LEPPDTQEKQIRFGCGFVFGFFIIGLSSIRHLLSNGYGALAVAALIGFLCGFAAMKNGDKFWYSLLMWKWWP
jgi:uncharacterized membrane protein SpoIIM required for sporulation